MKIQNKRSNSSMFYFSLNLDSKNYLYTMSQHTDSAGWTITPYCTATAKHPDFDLIDLGTYSSGNSFKEVGYTYSSGINLKKLEILTLLVIHLKKLDKLTLLVVHLKKLDILTLLVIHLKKQDILTLLVIHLKKQDTLTLLVLI